MKKNGFTIIELLIVITIIGILIGVAVPYYNDYIYDARLSVLKQNLATWRSAINQFRGDNLRGPFSVQVAGTVTHGDAKNSAESELSAGPIQIVDSTPTRRANIKYIPRLPVIQDPTSGADIPATSWTLGSPTAYFHDADNDGIFDIDAEFAFIDGNNNGSFTDANDAKFDNGILLIALPSVPFVPAGPFLPLDYTTVTVTGSDGSIY